MSRSIYLALIIMVPLSIFQASALTRLALWEMTPQLVLLVAVAWALLRGAYEGALWAFIAGILVDLFSYSPMGATSLALMAAVLVVVRVQQVLPENHILLPGLFSGLAIALYLVLYLLILRLTGRPLSLQILTALAPTVLIHAVLGLPIYGAMYYLERMLYPRHIEA